MNIDSDACDGLMDGFQRCSRDMPGRMDCRAEPNLDNVSAASF
jgi:hypothetical protein